MELPWTTFKTNPKTLHGLSSRGRQIHPKINIFFLLSSLAKKRVHLETNRVQWSIEDAMLYITAKTGFLKTHI